MKPVIELSEEYANEHYPWVLFILINLKIIIKVFFDISTTYLKKEKKKTTRSSRYQRTNRHTF